MNFDFKKIDVEDFLHELGMNKVSKKGNQVWFSCPLAMHIGSDNTPSISMELGTTRIHCFGCGFSGNAVSFLSELENISPLKARRFLRERFQIGFREPNETFSDEINKRLERSEKLQQVSIAKIDRQYHILSEKECDKRFINWYDVDTAWQAKIEAAYPLAYMLDRGFRPDILNEWAIGWDMISQRIAIPIRDDLGNLVGFKGRTADNRLPKYLVLGGPEYGFETYNVSQVLFGLDKAKEYIEDLLIVVEGELNAISISSKGYKNVVGISGRNISETQEKLIKAHCSKVLFIFDDQKDSYNAAKSLEKFISVLIAPQHSVDPAEMSENELDAIISCAVPSIML